MKSRHLILALTGACTAVALIANAPQGISSEMDDLWMRATTIARANADWLPGRVEKQERVLNKNGELEIDNQVILEFGRSMEGAAEVRLVSYLANGKDVTSEARRETERKALASLREDYAKGAQPPFASLGPGEQLIKTFEKTVVHGGKSCAVFRFIQTGGVQDIQGRVWIDCEDGDPLKTEIEVISAPFKDGRSTILGMKRTADFGRTATGALCIVAERIEAAMRTSTLLHTFEGVIEDTLRYSAHWKET